MRREAKEGVCTRGGHAQQAGRGQAHSVSGCKSPHLPDAAASWSQQAATHCCQVFAAPSRTCLTARSKMLPLHASCMANVALHQCHHMHRSRTTCESLHGVHGCMSCFLHAVTLHCTRGSGMLLF